MDGACIAAAPTGAAAVVAANALACPDARVLAILGADVQGARTWRPAARADLGEVRVATRGLFEEAVAGADVVCCCTDARQPVIRAAWLAPAPRQLGSSFGPEFDPDTARAGRVLVEWRGAVLN